MTSTRFYVSSPHKVGAHGAERPYGLQHAREPGSKLTECGEPAVNWPLFWDRPFADDLGLACRKCINSVVMRHHGAVRPRASDDLTEVEGPRPAWP